MHFQAFLVAGLSAAAVAQLNEPIQEQDINDPEILSIVSVIQTAIPTSFLAAIEDPAAAASLESEFAAGNVPSWYAALPTDVQSFLNVGESVLDNSPFSSFPSTPTDAPTSDLSTDESEAPTSDASDDDDDDDDDSDDSDGQDDQDDGDGESDGGDDPNSAGSASTPSATVFAAMAGAAGLMALVIGL